jgi:hypothetical protein
VYFFKNLSLILVANFKKCRTFYGASDISLGFLPFSLQVWFAFLRTLFRHFAVVGPTISSFFSCGLYDTKRNN